MTRPRSPGPNASPTCSSSAKNPRREYYEADPLARFDRNAEPFDERGDYKIDEKQKRVTFTNQGMNHMEEELLNKHKVINGSIYDDSNFEFVHYVTQAVRAHRLFFDDVDYVVVDGQVQIVDEFTGRILYGRRYSDGLHQAIEAEGAHQDPGAEQDARDHNLPELLQDVR